MHSGMCVLLMALCRLRQLTGEDGERNGSFDTISFHSRTFTKAFHTLRMIPSSPSLEYVDNSKENSYNRFLCSQLNIGSIQCFQSKEDSSDIIFTGSCFRATNAWDSEDMKSLKNKDLRIARR